MRFIAISLCVGLMVYSVSCAPQKPGRDQEFMKKAEDFFKKSALGIGMSKEGVNATWRIMMKYSSQDTVDPTRRITPQVGFV